VKIITTSWDDGHPLDFKIASLLEYYGLKGTFYIPKSNPENEVMNEDNIIRLGEKFEIGGHTIHHSSLNSSDSDFLKSEIIEGKIWMDNLLSMSTICFCYPKGLYTTLAVNIVKEAGYKYARTVELLQTEVINHHLAPTSLQLYKHSNLVYLINPIRRSGFIGFLNFLKNNRLENKLESLTNLMLDNIEENDGIFHLWGHSWEIENENLWNDLEKVLKICSKRDNFSKMSNSELV